jgi:hypothetical protein
MGEEMKYAATRYGFTAGMASLLSSSVMIALESVGLIRFVIAGFLAVFTWIGCTAIVPYHDKGDN